MIFSGSIQNYQSCSSGTYRLQSSPFNGHPWWKKGIIDKEVLSYDVVLGHWEFGRIEALDKRTAFIQSVPSFDEWPNEIFSGWEYVSGSSWYLAGNDDVIIEGNDSCSKLHALCMIFSKAKIFLADSESFTKKMLGILKFKK